MEFSSKLNNSSSIILSNKMSARITPLMYVQVVCLSRRVSKCAPPARDHESKTIVRQLYKHAIALMPC